MTKVLVIDADELAQQFPVGELKGLGIVLTSTKDEALERLQGGDFDVVVIDPYSRRLRLDEIGTKGPEDTRELADANILQEIRGTGYHGPVIILSGALSKARIEALLHAAEMTFRIPENALRDVNPVHEANNALRERGAPEIVQNVRFAHKILGPVTGLTTLSEILTELNLSVAA